MVLEISDNIANSRRWKGTTKHKGLMLDCYAAAKLEEGFILAASQGQHRSKNRLTYLHFQLSSHQHHGCAPSSSQDSQEMESFAARSCADLELSRQSHSAAHTSLRYSVQLSILFGVNTCQPDYNANQDAVLQDLAAPTHMNVSQNLLGCPDAESRSFYTCLGYVPALSSLPT